MAMILQICTTGSPKTKIMYKAFLSYTQLKEYLGLLEHNNLIDYEAANQLYRTTEKGRLFLHSYDEMSGLISAERPVDLIDA
jgi:predicted transcriptional regulator